MKMKNGDWINNKKEGKGIMKYKNGDEYDVIGKRIKKREWVL